MYQIKDITNNRNKRISFEDVEHTVYVTQRLFEYNAAKISLEQARERGKIQSKDHENHNTLQS